MNVHVKINDVTLREGDQAPLTSFIRDEKMVIAAMQEELGVDNIEAGFAASRVDYDNIRGVFNVIDENGPIIATLGRAIPGDTQASLNVIKGYKNARIHIFLATSDEHILAKFGSKAPTIIEMKKWLREQVKNEVGRAKTYKDTHNKQLEIEFSPEDATGNALTQEEDGKKYLNFKSDQFNYLVEICGIAIRAGATIINTPDTLGNLLPHETESFFRELTKRLSHLKNEGFLFELSAHIHNDLGMASANAISAIRGGATQIELTINGIGERTGNTSLHEILGIISEKGHAILDGGEVTISPKIKLGLVGPTSNFVRRILGHDKDLQAPFIGALSDIDGSGVHNAAQDVYGGTKNKRKFGGGNIPEFFSPRGGANQIVSMLGRFGISQDSKSQIISSITQKACERAEKVKALYAENIYSLYQKELENFSIDDIKIEGNKVQLEFSYNGEKYIISGEGEGENGFTRGLINGINTFLGSKIVEIDSIDIVNKPSLRNAYNRYLEESNEAGVKLSHGFKQKIETILGNAEDAKSDSRQLGISHVNMEIEGRKVRSVGKAQDINYAIAKAILDGALPKIIEKIDSTEQ